MSQFLVECLKNEPLYGYSEEIKDAKITAERTKISKLKRRSQIDQIRLIKLNTQIYYCQNS